MIYTVEIVKDRHNAERPLAVEITRDEADYVCEKLPQFLHFRHYWKVFGSQYKKSLDGFGYPYIFFVQGVVCLSVFMIQFYSLQGYTATCT